MKSKVEINSEFLNDEAVVGRWEVVDTVRDMEEFSPGKLRAGSTFFEELYFLPDGGEYWIFSWTKGYIKISSGDGKMLCPYKTEVINGMLYMFMMYDELIIVLQQTDSKHYTKQQTGQQDNIDLPFVNDEQVLGKWSAVDFVKKIEDFDPAKQIDARKLVYKSAEFLPGGELLCEMNGPMKAKWTKATTLERTGDGDFAAAYEIRTVDRTEYLFIEWKGGDYRWGKRKPCYYVFTRG